MDEVTALLAWAKSGVTVGGVGVWVLVLLWWKSLPSILDSWSRRSEVENKRISDELSRLHGLHAECEERASRDRQEAQEQIKQIRSEAEERERRLYGQIDDLREKVAALTAAKFQQQVSTASLLARALPDSDSARLEELAHRATSAMRGGKP